MSKRVLLCDDEIHILRAAEFKLKLAGDGKPAVDEFFAWEKSLQKRDFTDFARGMGNWQDSGTGAKFSLDKGAFTGNTSRREFIHFAKPDEVGDFTFEFDTRMDGNGNRANGAPVAMVSREQRTKRHTYTAFRAFQANTFSKDGFIMSESWMPVGRRIPYKGDAAKEIVGEQWIHMKIAGKGDELIMFINDWPVYRVKEQPMAKRWLSIQNGYDNMMRLDNILLKYSSPQ